MADGVPPYANHERGEGVTTELRPADRRVELLVQANDLLAGLNQAKREAEQAGMPGLMRTFRLAAFLVLDAIETLEEAAAT